MSVWTKIPFYKGTRRARSGSVLSLDNKVDDMSDGAGTVVEQLEAVNVELSSTRAQLSDLQGQVEQAAEELNTAQELNAELQTQIDAAQASVLQLDEVTAERDAHSATIEAQAKLLARPEHKQASGGTAPVADGGEPNGEDLVKQYSELKGPAKMAFFRANKTALIAAGGNN